MNRPVFIRALLASAVGVACSGVADDRVGSPGAADAALVDTTGRGDDAGSDGSSGGDGDDGGSFVPDAPPADAGAMDARGSDAATDAPEEAPPPACPILQTMSAPAGAARSAGFSGTDMAYFALYSGPCQVASDCVSACALAGGTMASCASGSECLPGEMMDGGLGCLPPTYWLTVTGALSESAMTTNAAELILVDIPYDDPLVMTNFGVSIPDDAIITGIQFKVRRGTLTGNAVDDTVQILQNGAPVGANHGTPGAWPGTLAYESYGGAYDLWGASWTAADVRSSGFGISIAPKYTGPTAGNERAYIDSVRVTVFYMTACD